MTISLVALPEEPWLFLTAQRLRHRHNHQTNWYRQDEGLMTQTSEPFHFPVFLDSHSAGW